LSVHSKHELNAENVADVKGKSTNVLVQSTERKAGESKHTHKYACTHMNMIP